MSVLQQVVSLVAQQLGLDPKTLTAETDLVAEYGMDSLDEVELIMELEELFDVSVPDDVAEKIRTIGDIVAFIEKEQA